MMACAHRSTLSCLLRRPDPARAATYSLSRIASLALIAIAATGAAQAATTFNIATTSMANAVDGQCTLVEALAAVQANATVNECVSTTGPYTINLSPGTYSFTASTHVDGNFGNSAYGITAADLTVNGGGATLDRGASAVNMRLFYVGNFRSLTLRNLTVSGFNASNTAEVVAHWGGAIGMLQGTLNIEDSTFSGNTAGFGGPFDGMAIIAFASTVNIHRSTFANNNSTITNTGQVRLTQGSTLNIANSTFQGLRFAIGITDNSTGHMSNVTLFGQVSLIFDATGTANVRNSLLPSGCSMNGGTLNLVNSGTHSTCGGTTTFYTLLALAGNGGPTQTRGILVGEFPQDKAPGCTYASAPGNPLFTDGAAIATDQRGFARDASCDLGAVELFSVSALTPFAAQFGTAYSGTITASGGGAPITFAAGTVLPPGLSISAGGVLSGTPTAAGTFTFDIVATDSGGFKSTRRYLSFPIAKANQAITFGAQVPASRPFAPSSTFTINPLASSDSGLAVSYSSGTTGVCLVSGTTVTMVSVGTCTIRANQFGNVNYNAAAQVTQDVAFDAVVPDAPTIGTAVAGNAQASVAFTAPAFNGGSAILDYTATCGSQSATGTASPLVVTGLGNGTAYTCTVVARNAVGTGPASAASNNVTPVTVPSAPTGVNATAGNAQISVAFTPGGNGGSALLDFTANCGSQSATGAGSPLVVTGLANGTAYTCTVTARNAVGTGPASAPSNSVTPATIPGAPAIGTATPGNTQISVAFTPPASNGGSAILDYTATCGSQSATGPASPITVSGLANGTPYTCTVVARNVAGTGPASAASGSATPLSVPFAPTGATATAGNAQITVAFTPGADGGSPILDFTASCGTQSASGAASPIVVTGLTNGTAYTCTVTARNVAGMSAPSTASSSVTPATIPGAPTIGTATPGNAQISVVFVAPASNGGSAILDYTAVCGSRSATGSASPVTVSGLVNGTAYTCAVTARNAVGTGPASAASNSATPVTVPFAPTGVTATAGNAQISVAFTPGGDGGSPLLDFTATCGSQSNTGTASPLVVAGLVNGTAYTCTVRARNATGTSAPSTASNSATPTVSTFSGPSATGSGTITATFSGGGPTCTYTASRFIPVSGDPASPPTAPPAGMTFPHGLFDFTTASCTPGSTITMTITYPQPLLTGTLYWKYGPTPSDPVPHWYVLPATVTGNAVTFTLTDGALGDDDLAANGTIVDQGGPGVPGAAVAVPTLSEWAMLLLAGLVMLAGMAAMRRRS